MQSRWTVPVQRQKALPAYFHDEILKARWMHRSLKTGGSSNSQNQRVKTVEKTSSHSGHEIDVCPERATAWEELRQEEPTPKAHMARSGSYVVNLVKWGFHCSQPARPPHHCLTHISLLPHNHINTPHTSPARQGAPSLPRILLVLAFSFQPSNHSINQLTSIESSNTPLSLASIESSKKQPSCPSLRLFL